jgi:hypothetical protein
MRSKPDNRRSHSPGIPSSNLEMTDPNIRLSTPAGKARRPNSADLAAFLTAFRRSGSTTLRLGAMPGRGSTRADEIGTPVSARHSIKRPSIVIRQKPTIQTPRSASIKPIWK